ncbi:hypothetical protein [Paenibacillus sp.]|uniref:hypothetical protein n=1 Tax=Paenibacillus sp. TaxID=58172 RepID=UPI002811CFA5|nr:hypothetical protein [Paenibacillus sp.]
MKLHIAKDGDSINALSEKYGVARERILAANPQLGGTEALARGAKVKIPTGPVFMSASGGARQPEPIAPYAAAAFAGHRQETQAQAAAEPAAELPEPTLPTTTASMPTVSTLPTVPSAPPIASMPSVPTASNAPTAASAPAMNSASPTISPAGSESLPSYYKTEPAVGDQSPLHVQWSGMNDGPAAEHPFAPLPTPVVPAGAPTFYPGPFGYGHVPAAPPYGAFGPTDPSAFATYGAIPEPFPSPFPSPFPPPFQGHPSPASHDCGCGGPAVSRLPYALPLRGGEERAYASAAQGQAPEAAPTAGTAETAPPAAKAEAKKARSRKKNACVSSSDDLLRSFLKRASGVRRSSRRKSRPWVND